MTWSIESVVFKVGAIAAVAAQGVIDLISPPRLGRDWDYPIPGCPNAGDCREFGCAGDCSEASEARMEVNS